MSQFAASFVYFPNIISHVLYII